MPRFSDRKERLLEIPGRFEAQPSSAHAHYALGAIGRLRDEGDNFWIDGSDQNTRWKKYCTILYRFINGLGKRRHIDKQPLKIALREFIQEFEHSTSRLYEMLYGTCDDPDNSSDIDRIVNWFDLVFRLSIFAVVSSWIDDKAEEGVVRVEVNMTTGETSEHSARKEMQVPRKYRHTTKKLL